jgi:hypothetical protein
MFGAGQTAGQPVDAAFMALNEGLECGQLTVLGGTDEIRIIRLIDHILTQKRWSGCRKSNGAA